MNAFFLIGFAVTAFVAAYFLYGRWLAGIWGIDRNARTPAIRFEGQEDFAPASKVTVFAHQFTSIAGAGPITGPVIGAMFGWLPALLRIVFGGIFMGAVHDFAALYASIKHDGKSLGTMLEAYVGRTGRNLFLIFCWLYTILVGSAFTDILANTFEGFTPDGTKIFNNAAAASTSILYTFAAIAFGAFVRRTNLAEELRFSIGLLLMMTMVSFGLELPIYLPAWGWRILVLGYCFAAAVLPLWFLIQPRNYLSSLLLLGMVVVGALGMMIRNPTLDMPAFTGWNVNGASLFPFLFTTVACGAISGFHSLVSSGISARSLSNEGDTLFVGYGAMLVESLLAVVALAVACSASKGGVLPPGTPFQLFAGSIGSFLYKMGMPKEIARCLITVCIACLAMTTIDSVIRTGRTTLQELMTPPDGRPGNIITRFCTSVDGSTAITTISAYILCNIGYRAVWELFGATNQLLASLVLIALAVFMRITHRKCWMLCIPMIFMFIVTMSSLALTLHGITLKIMDGTFNVNDGLQMAVAMPLMILALLVAVHCGRELITGKVDEEPADSAEGKERPNCTNP